MSFESDIKNWIKKVKDNVETVVVETRFECSDRIINSTPVYTGYARGNWQAETGSSYPTQEIMRYDDEMGYAPTSGEGESLWEAKNVAVLNIVKPFYLVNNVDYINDLEYGKSNQAPRGMVRLVVADFDNIVLDIVRKL